MGRPEGKGVAESVGAPEKVKPGTGKQLKGSGWLQSLDEKLAGELKSGDQGDKLSSVSPKVKGGVSTKGKKTVAEGEVPEAFKKQWKKKGGEEKPEDEGDDKPEDKPEDKGDDDKPEFLKKESKDVAEILKPYIESKELTAETIAKAIVKLKEAAKEDESLAEKVQLVEGYYVSDKKTTYGDVLELLKPFLGEEATLEAIDEAIKKLKEAAEKDESLKESVEIIDNLDLDDFKAVLEAQYKFASKGLKPIGYKKSSISEGEGGEGDLSEAVAVMLSTDEKIDDVIDSVVGAMQDMEGGEGEIAPVPPPFGGEAAEAAEEAEEEAEEAEEAAGEAEEEAEEAEEAAEEL
jgi:vacuolar-type H+-ATPase subunit I/STV1